MRWCKRLASRSKTGATRTGRQGLMPEEYRLAPTPLGSQMRHVRLNVARD